MKDKNDDKTNARSNNTITTAAINTTLIVTTTRHAITYGMMG